MKTRTLIFLFVTGIAFVLACNNECEKKCCPSKHVKECCESKCQKKCEKKCDTTAMNACDSAHMKKCEKTACKYLMADSLIGIWNSTWNSRDVEAIKKLFAKDAMLVAGDWKLEGIQAITDEWISTSAPTIANLSTTALKKDAKCKFAFSSGTYTHDVLKENKVDYQANGVYTIIWKRKCDKSWKVELVNIQDLTK